MPRQTAARSSDARRRRHDARGHATRGRARIDTAPRRAVSAFFGGRGIDDALDLRDLVGGEAALLRVLAHHVFARRDVHAVGLVAGDVALHPLDLRAQALEDVARFLRDGLQLVRAELAGAGNLALDEVFGHGPLPVMDRAQSSARLADHTPG